MAQLLIKAGDQSAHPGQFKDGDVVVVKDDGHVWGRCESLAVWKSDGLDPKDWPGGFEIVQVPGEPKESYSHLLEEGPVRVRGLPNYKSLAAVGDVRVAMPFAIDAIVEVKP